MENKITGDVTGTPELQMHLTQFAMENVSIEIYWLGIDARIFYANNQACKTLGYTKQEFQQLTISDLDPNYPIDLWEDHFQHLKNDKTQTFETLHKRKDGSEFPVEVIANYVCFDGQEYNVGFARDITERKLAEAALYEQEAFFRTISENVEDYIAVLDLDGKRIYNNPSYANLFGDINAIKGSDCFAEIHPDDRDHIKEKFQETVQKGIGHRAEYRFSFPGGSVRNMESRGWLIKDAQGKPLRVIVLSHDITERKISESNIHDLAFHDALTQLPNRRLLDDRLEHAIATSKRSGHFGAVMFLDLDNFKPLNDRHGHKAGDLLLIEVARRLEGCMREVDTVARFGGDEFVVVVSELDGTENECKEQALNLAEKIRTALAGTYWLGSNISGTSKMIIHNNIAVSIGVALFKNNSDAEKILKYADKAMYRAKETGRNKICFYE
jgi:diguanylate cyclase (GGDEF)-like protein/PAS domain S-box-containing protein